MKLNAISTAAQNARIPGFDADLTQVAIQEMINAHPLLSILEFFPMIGNSESKRKNSAATTGAFRALNADYDDAATTPAYVTATLRTFGGSYRVDQAYIRRGLDIPSLMLSDLRSVAMNAAYKFVDQIVNADGTGNTFSGLKTLTPAGMTVNYGGNNGDTIDTTAKQTKFFEELDAMLLRVRPQNRVILASGALISRITNAYRNAFNYITQGEGIGRPILAYNGIPVITAGQDKDGNEILPNTETLGTSTNCQSLYVISSLEGANYSIGTSTGFSVSQAKVGVYAEVIAEGDFAPALLDDKALGRIQGIRL